MTQFKDADKTVFENDIANSKALRPTSKLVSGNWLPIVQQEVFSSVTPLWMQHRSSSWCESVSLMYSK
ncbi:hypothetical protein Y032_0115g518 [Ancylostoma ceylanicum]|nr:hypothetical protein Y032_0115g518 [Ancylostoma ceylanicum]